MAAWRSDIGNGMIPVVIFGTNKYSEAAYRFIVQSYNKEALNAGGEELDVITFADFNGPGGVSGYMPDEKPVCDLGTFVDMYRAGQAAVIIIPRENLSGHTMFITDLIKNGIKPENIYLTGRIAYAPNDRDGILDFINPYISSGYLPYLEFHLADHCNLNCSACEHYSGLVKEKKFTDYDRFSKDMNRFHELIGDLGMIRIMGGEPLLNRDIEKYIRLVRSLYPHAHTAVVTNALLIKSMPESLFETMRENDVHFYISYYPPLKDKMDPIVDHIRARGVQVEVSPLIEKFRKRQLLKPHDNPQGVFYNCSQAHCNNLYEGKVAACFLPFTTKYFNEYFDEKIPGDGAVDLYEPGLTAEKLVISLLLPFDRCSYCSADYDEVDWRIVTDPSTLDDWIM